MKAELRRTKAHQNAVRDKVAIAREVEEAEQRVAERQMTPEPC